MTEIKAPVRTARSAHADHGDIRRLSSSHYSPNDPTVVSTCTNQLIASLSLNLHTLRRMAQACLYRPIRHRRNGAAKSQNSPTSTDAPCGFRLLHVAPRVLGHTS